MGMDQNWSQNLVGGAITILKNSSQWEGLSHILWNIEKIFETTNQIIMPHHLLEPLHTWIPGSSGVLLLPNRPFWLLAKQQLKKMDRIDIYIYIMDRIYIYICIIYYIIYIYIYNIYIYLSLCQIRSPKFGELSCWTRIRNHAICLLPPAFVVSCLKFTVTVS